MRVFSTRNLSIYIYQKYFYRSGGAVKKETLCCMALELSPDYRHECGIWMDCMRPTAINY